MNGIHERLMRAEQGVRGIVSLLQFTNIFTKVTRHIYHYFTNKSRQTEKSLQKNGKTDEIMIDLSKKKLIAVSVGIERKNRLLPDGISGGNEGRIIKQESISLWQND